MPDLHAKYQKSAPEKWTQHVSVSGTCVASGPKRQTHYSFTSLANLHIDLHLGFMTSRVCPHDTTMCQSCIQHCTSCKTHE